jgi:hypothetical protein
MVIRRRRGGNFRVLLIGFVQMTFMTLGVTSGEAPRPAKQRQLLKDTAFAEGFGAAFIYGKRFSAGPFRNLGKVLEYRRISPWTIRLIPDGPVSEVGVRSHAWDFQEGYHHDFIDETGRRVRELHAHRLVVNHVVEANTPSTLQFAQFNNYALSRDDPRRDTDSITRDHAQPRLGTRYTVEREVKKLVGDALAEARKKQPDLPGSPEGYRLYNFSIGWEGMGHWEAQCELSALSLLGTPRDSE